MYYLVSIVYVVLSEKENFWLGLYDGDTQPIKLVDAKQLVV